MDQGAIDAALAELDTTELKRFARAADRLLAARSTVLEGARPERRAGRSLEFLDHAPYAAGHDARTVDWRASARSPGLLVRRYHQELRSEWYLCVDASASLSVDDGSKWRLAIQIAAAAGYLLLHRGNRVGLLRFSDRLDDRLPARAGRGQFARILAHLARWRPQQRGAGSDLSVCLPGIPRLASAVVISDFLTPDAMRDELALIAARGGRLHALQVLAPDECGLEGDGAITIVDVESGERTVVDAKAGPAQARARLRAEQAGLARFCDEHLVTFSSSVAGTPWRSILVRHLERSAAHARVAG